MKLIDLLKSLAKKGKLDITKPEVIASLEAAKDIDVPQEFADQLEAALMTTDAAVSNKDVRSRITAEVLNGEDAFITGIINDLDFEETVKSDITAERDTRAKIRKTFSAITADKKKGRKPGDSNTTEEALKLQVADLNKKIKDNNDLHAAEIVKLNANADKQFEDYQLMSLLGSKQYAFPDKMPQHQKVKTALLSIQDALEQKGYKVIKNESGTGVKLLKKDGTDPYNDKNILLELSSFVDGVLAENGLLKNSDPAPTRQDNNNQNYSPNANGGNGNGHAPAINHEYIKQMDAIADQLLKPSN